MMTVLFSPNIGAPAVVVNGRFLLLDPDYDDAQLYAAIRALLPHIEGDTILRYIDEAARQTSVA